MKIFNTYFKYITCTLISVLINCPLSALDKPNILIILADDLGYGSLNCYGAVEKHIRTPNIDRIAKEGVRFTNAHTPASVCSPSRYALMTGRYGWRTDLKWGVVGMFDPLQIETNRLTVASLLKNQGYSTAAIGKWHLGFGATQNSGKFTKSLRPGPQDIGFDYYYGIAHNHNDPTGVYLENDGVEGLKSADLSPYGMTFYRMPYMGLDAPQRDEQQVMDVLTDKTVEWLKTRNPTQPFFLYFAPVAVHHPCTPSVRSRNTSGIGAYGDWIHDLDASVGRILDALEVSHQAANTLVIFTSDNGGVVMPKGDEPEATAYSEGFRACGSLRGGKHSIYEGGTRVPYLARWPEKIKPGRVCDEPINLVDTLATVAALVKEPIPPATQAAEDSFNVLPALLGEPYQIPLRPEMVLHNTAGVYALRQGQWKYIEGIPAQPGKAKERNEEYTEQLYNLGADPSETENLLGRYPDVAARLKQALERCRNASSSRELGNTSAVCPVADTTVSAENFSLARGGASVPLNEGEYQLHADGGIIYNPLSRDAKRKGELAKFEKITMQTGTLDLGAVTLKYEVPTSAEAYDVVPVKYELESKTPNAKRPLAVECTAFEDKERKKGRALFDMSLPGDLGVKIEYVGHVAADAVPNRPMLDPQNPDPNIKDYPPWKSDSIVRSGVIRKADYNWFTFRYTVTGDTIFDPEGFNGVQTEISLFKKNPEGDYKPAGTSINCWERPVNYQYPGEVCEQTFTLRGIRGMLPPGEYKLRYTLQQKSYRRWTVYGNHWGGEPIAQMDLFLTVVDGVAEVVEPKTDFVFMATAKEGNFPEHIHSFEEFMTGFEWFRQPVSKEEGTLYIQVAPWTKHLDLKLIMGSPMELKAVSLPIKVSNDKLALKYNPDNPFVLTREGKEEPVILAQLMPGMRHSVHFGHRPDQIMRDLVNDAKACGVNVYAAESGGWALEDFFRKPQAHDALGEATRYFNHNLGSFNMPMLGHGIYGVQLAYRYGNKILKSPLTVPAVKESDSSHHLVSEWAETWAAVVLYNHALWGNNWYKTRDGKTIIDIEDTVGWMREGAQHRYTIGAVGLIQFREWCKKKYGSIEKLNRAWGSFFEDFEAINPEKNQSSSPFGHKWEYHQKTDLVFYDWSVAINDFDQFRSEARATSYKQIIEILRKTIPGATLDLRTEGGNFIIPDASRLGDTPHERHVKYSARRNAMIGEVLSQYADEIAFYSDYTTMPYTPDEWRKFTRLSVEKNIRPMPLPHLSRTRDIVLQQKWGEDYTAHYDLKHPARGAMVFALQASFPVMQAVYEEGGCPGVIWADYTCDAFITETQKRELKLLRQVMDNMKMTNCSVNKTQKQKESKQ